MEPRVSRAWVRAQPLLLSIVIAAAWVNIALAKPYHAIQLTGLEALFNATNGEQWFRSTGWLDASIGACTWYGVVCDDDSKNVTGLALSGNGLIGNLSKAEQLFDVVSLKNVDLSDNHLLGPVPLGFGFMSRLEILDLSWNQLSSFPTNWGLGASSLQHLLLQSNNISGTLPSAWIEVNTSTSHPLVHVNEGSSWLPSLRTLTLRSNKITMAVYYALQSVIALPSLQTLDLSGNVLSAELSAAFDLYHCEGGSLDKCSFALRSSRVSPLTTLLLEANAIEGVLEAGVLPKSLSVFSVSENRLYGPVPEDYSQLSVFLADGNGGLNDTSLPSFASYVNSSAVLVSHENLWCPVITGNSAGGITMRLRLDPSYLDYTHCVCAKGMEVYSGDECRPCAAGTYRSAADLFTSPSCAACPVNSWTLTTGAESALQCKCQEEFYDILAGRGKRGPSCVDCPNGGGGWEDLGAISVKSCSCPAGRYLNEIRETCTECEAGTFKSSVGNDPILCIPCPEGTYSAVTGGTSKYGCMPCESGTYSVTSGARASSSCIPCPGGTYSAVTGSFTADLCVKCPAGYYSEEQGATDTEVCQPCPRGKFSSEIGASSEDSCKLCEDGLSSLGGSAECEIWLTNSRRTLVIYLIVGASTLAVIFVAYYTWQKKVHKNKNFRIHSRTETPVKMAMAKREAQMWAVFFHTLETLDVVTGNALFIYLLEIGAVRGLIRHVYWLVVSMGLVLNVYRLYKVLWMQCVLTNILVAEKVDKEGKLALVVSMPGGKRRDRRIMTPDDAKMVLELVKILKHLQVNKFKVQLAVVMDLPLTFLNLYLLWKVESDLILSPLFITSLVINVFSAGKISTLIEYHLELRQRKRKLERLLMIELTELKNSKSGRDDMDAELEAESNAQEGQGVDECFEHGDPETLLKFHGQSMRNIPTKEAGTRNGEYGKKLANGGGYKRLDVPMTEKGLQSVIDEKGFYMYVAGTALLVCSRFGLFSSPISPSGRSISGDVDVGGSSVTAGGGVTIDNYLTTLPLKKGLSSSAAVCVLVVKALGIVYDLNLDIQQVMELAHLGEARAGSKCGRMDQCCALGTNHVAAMFFDGQDVKIYEVIPPKSGIFLVVADLNGTKDTVKMLASLNNCFPHAKDEQEIVFHSYLRDNAERAWSAVAAIESGNAKDLGRAMTEAQESFDSCAIPICPSEFSSPLLHAVILDQRVKKLTWAVKGVGAQGDGSVQMLARGREEQEKLIRVLKEMGMTCVLPVTVIRPDGGAPAHSAPPADRSGRPTTVGTRHSGDESRGGIALSNGEGPIPFASALTVPSLHTRPMLHTRRVRTAVIVAAGLSTRMFPASAVVKKELFPIVDHDGVCKPVILAILEGLAESGIERFVLVVQERDVAVFDDFFSMKAVEMHKHRLKPPQRDYCARIEAMRPRITYAIQDKQEGFGHAVYCARDALGIKDHDSYGAGLKKDSTSCSAANEDEVDDHAGDTKDHAESFLLVLGDHLYRRGPGTTQACASQLIHAYLKHGEAGKPAIGLKVMAESSVSPYGVAAGDCIGHPPAHILERWQLAVTTRAAAETRAAAPMNSNNKDASDSCGDGALPLGGRVYRLTKLVEKPTVEFARENLLTPGLGPGPDGEGSHLVVFGQYVLPARRTFDILAEDIRADRRERGEFQLTSVLDRMRREDDGMLGCVIHGNALDMGIPRPYVATMAAFAKPHRPW